MGEGRVTRITCRLNLSVIIYLGGFLIGQEAISRRLFDSGKMKAEKTEKRTGEEGWRERSRRRYGRAMIDFNFRPTLGEIN